MAIFRLVGNKRQERPGTGRKLHSNRLSSVSEPQVLSYCVSLLSLGSLLNARFLPFHLPSLLLPVLPSTTSISNFSNRYPGMHPRFFQRRVSVQTVRVASATTSQVIMATARLLVVKHHCLLFSLANYLRIMSCQWCSIGTCTRPVQLSWWWQFAGDNQRRISVINMHRCLEVFDCVKVESFGACRGLPSAQSKYSTNHASIGSGSGIINL